MSRSLGIRFVVGAVLSSTVNKVFTTTTEKAQGLRKELAKATMGKKLMGEMTKYKSQLAELRQRQTSAGHANTNLNRKIAETQRAFGAAAQEAQRYGITVGNVAKQQKAFAQQADLANRALKRQSVRERNKNVRSEAGGQLFGAVGVALAVAAPVKIAAEFEQSMAEVGAVANLDLAGEQFKQLTATARKLGGTTAWSASQSAEGMKYLAMAGFKTNEIISAMPGMLSLASAGAIDLGSAADIASNILSGFKMPADEMGRLGDVLTNTFTTSNTSLTMLGETMKYVAPVAQSLGVSVELAAAMAGKLGDVGIQGSQAGTALRAMFSRLANPPKAAQNALDELGVSTTDAEGNLRDMAAVLADLDKAMQGYGSADKAQFTGDIFGVEAMSAATELMNKAGTGELQTYADSLKKTGSAAEVARKQQETLKGRITQLKSATESLAITFGNVLKPAIGWVTQTMTSGATALQDFSDKHPMLIKMLIGLGGAAAAAKIGMLGFRYGATQASDAVAFFGDRKDDIIRFFGKVKTNAPIAGNALLSFSRNPIKSVIAGFRAMSVAMLTNPIGWIALGIGGAALLIYKFWAPIKDFFSGLWAGLSTGWKMLASKFPAIHAFGESIKSLFSALTSQAEGGANFQIAGLETGLTVARGIVSAIEFISAGLELLDFGHAVEYWKQSIQEGIDWIRSINLADAGQAMIQSIVAGITSMPGAIMGAIQAAAGGAWKFVKGIFGGGGDTEKVAQTFGVSKGQAGTMVSGISKSAAVSQYAAGGLVTRPHLGIVGEAGPEMIIPLRDKQRGMSLLSQAAQHLGVGQVGQAAKALRLPAPSMDTAGPVALPQLTLPAFPDLNSMASTPASRPQSQASGSGQIVINFSPSITVNGGGDAQTTANAVQTAVEQSIDQLKEMLASEASNARRLAFD